MKLTFKVRSHQTPMLIFDLNLNCIAGLEAAEVRHRS